MSNNEAMTHDMRFNNLFCRYKIDERTPLVTEIEMYAPMFTWNFSFFAKDRSYHGARVFLIYPIPSAPKIYAYAAQVSNGVVSIVDCPSNTSNIEVRETGDLISVSYFKFVTPSFPEQNWQFNFKPQQPCVFGMHIAADAKVLGPDRIPLKEVKYILELELEYQKREKQR